MGLGPAMGPAMQGAQHTYGGPTHSLVRSLPTSQQANKPTSLAYGAHSSPAIKVTIERHLAQPARRNEAFRS